MCTGEATCLCLYVCDHSQATHMETLNQWVNSVCLCRYDWGAAHTLLPKGVDQAAPCPSDVNTLTLITVAVTSEINAVGELPKCVKVIALVPLLKKYVLSPTRESKTCFNFITLGALGGKMTSKKWNRVQQIQYKSGLILSALQVKTNYCFQSIYLSVGLSLVHSGPLDHPARVMDLSSPSKWAWASTKDHRS